MATGEGRRGTPMAIVTNNVIGFVRRSPANALRTRERPSGGLPVFKPTFGPFRGGQGPVGPLRASLTLLRALTLFDVYTGVTKLNNAVVCSSVGFRGKEQRPAASPAEK